MTNCNGDIIIDGERSLVDTMSEYLNELRKTNEKVVTLEKRARRKRKKSPPGPKDFRSEVVVSCITV